MSMDIVSFNMEYVRTIVIMLLTKRNCTNSVWLFCRIKMPNFFSLSLFALV